MSFATDDRTESPLNVAIREADRIRREHNGVGGVYLYLGHDGDNVCTFKDIDGKEIAKASSGRSLLDAVEWCEREWEENKLLVRINSRLMELAKRAEKNTSAREFGRILFKTAAFIDAATDDFATNVTPYRPQVIEMLRASRAFVELEGDLWGRLPDGLRLVMPAPSPTPEGSVA